MVRSSIIIFITFYPCEPIMTINNCWSLWELLTWEEKKNQIWVCFRSSSIDKCEIICAWTFYQISVKKVFSVFQYSCCRRVFPYCWRTDITHQWETQILQNFRGYMYNTAYRNSNFVLRWIQQTCQQIICDSLRRSTKTLQILYPTF